MRLLQVPKEKDEQKALFKWASTHRLHSGHRLSELMWASTNGGKRDIRTAVSMKAQGAKAGIPDIFIAFPSKHYHGMFIELKRIKKGSVSKIQQRIIDLLNEFDYHAVVAYGWYDAMSKITDYLYE